MGVVLLLANREYARIRAEVDAAGSFWTWAEGAVPDVYGSSKGGNVAEVGQLFLQLRFLKEMYVPAVSNSQWDPVVGWNCCLAPKFKKYAVEVGGNKGIHNH